MNSSKEFLGIVENPLDEQILAASHKRNSKGSPMHVKSKDNIKEFTKEFYEF